MPHKKPGASDWSLDENDLFLVAFIEQYFWENDARTPPVEVVVAGVNLEPDIVEQLLRHEAINEYLKSRSIENPLTAPVPSGNLTAKQLFVANMILNRYDPGTLREKLKVLGVSIMEYQAWMADKQFSDYIQRRMNQVFIGSEWEVKNSLLNEATSGDISAQKLYFQLRGMLSERVDVNVNIDALIPQVVEVVANNVMRRLSKSAAEEIMNNIANDIEILIQTGSVPIPQDLILANSREETDAPALTS